MRKVKDFYYKKAKKDKYPARSVYKLAEIQQKYKFLRRGYSVLDIGCSPGSWSLYASELVGPKGVVVGVDLKEVDQSPREDGAEIHWLCHNVTEPEMITAVRKIRPAFRVIISDVAPKTTGNRWTDHQQSLSLVRHVLALTDHLLLNKGHLVCKVFQGEGFPQLVEDLKKLFDMVKVVKPKSSRVESREVFVVGMGFKKSKFCKPEG